MKKCDRMKCCFVGLILVAMVTSPAFADYAAPAGRVVAGGRKVADVPVDAWVGVEVLLHVPGPKAGTWSCTVTPPDGDPVTAEGLKVTPRFRTLDWIGFMSNGKEGTWHLDDFSVEPVLGTDCAMPSSPCSAGITHCLYHVDLIQCTRYAK